MLHTKSIKSLCRYFFASYQCCSHQPLSVGTSTGDVAALRAQGQKAALAKAAQAQETERSK